MELIAKQVDKVFTIYSQDEIYASIKFLDSKNSEINIDGNFFQTEAESDKNMLLKKDEKVIFKFKFDYLFGDAEIVSDESASNYEIIGRWFKPGTRLINEEDKDLVVVKNSGNDIEVQIVDEKVSKLMVVSTVYYHIYASSGKLTSLVFSSVIGGIM